MKVYRIKHIPTGLFFCPSRDVRYKLNNNDWLYVKSNLSKNGKTYIKKPTLKYIGDNFYNHLLPRENCRFSWANKNKMEKFVEDDWVIEEI